MYPSTVIQYKAIFKYPLCMHKPWCPDHLSAPLIITDSVGMGLLIAKPVATAPMTSAIYVLAILSLRLMSDLHTGYAAAMHYAI